MMYRILFIVLFLPISADAAIECKGSAFGLDSVYVLSAGTNKDLEVSAKILMNGAVVTERSGTAKYSSTVVSSISGEQESYYVFAPVANSFTELLSVSKDQKTIGDQGRHLILNPEIL